MVLVPPASAVARPPVEMLAVAWVSEAQVTLEVISFVELSLNEPVALNCCVAPMPTEGFAGVTAMETRVITVSFVLPITVPLVAWMVLVPPASAVARPPVEMVAVPGVSEAQVTLEVISFVELSLNEPVAVNCCVAPALMLGFGGVTAMLLRVAAEFEFDEQPARTRIAAANKIIARAQ
jgi:hypothetical protein